jgi:hypothetical protein
VRVAACLGIVLGIRDILWPEEPPSDGRAVRMKLFSFLDRMRDQVPQRGRGAYLRHFVENAIAVTKRYAKGLFHCYDDPRIPQTSNLIEGINGDGKRNLRRCGARGSTANGPGTSCGRAYMMAVALNSCLSSAEIEVAIASVPPADYREARALLDEIRAPSRRRRSMLRNPERYLSSILERWKGP